MDITLRLRHDVPAGDIMKQRVTKHEVAYVLHAHVGNWWEKVGTRVLCVHMGIEVSHTLGHTFL